MINISDTYQEASYHVLDEWKVTPIDEGLSNSAFIIEKGCEKFVCKFLDAGLSASVRYRILSMMHLAAEIGVGPKVVFADEQKGYVVMEYLEGTHPEIFDESAVEDAITSLRKIHRQTRYEPFSSIYERSEAIALDDRYALDSAISKVKEIECFVKQLGYSICHLDFHTKNIILSNGEAKIVDWDSCGFGHPYYDVAKLTHFLSWTEAEKVFGKYLNRSASKKEIACFYWMRAIVYMSIATNKLQKGNVEAGVDALQKFNEITEMGHYSEYLNTKNQW